MRKLMLLLVVLGLAGSLWAADPFVGTWKLNVPKSKFPGPAPKEATWIARAVGDQIEVTLTRTEANGAPFSLKCTYPQVGGVSKCSGPAQESAGITSVVIVVSPGNTYGTFLKDGKQQRFVHSVVSKDGKTAQDIIKGRTPQGKPFEELLVWDKQ